ncbi:SNARE domain protein [Cooperia oncophora]
MNLETNASSVVLYLSMISTQSSRMENNSERKLRENTVSALIFTLSQLTNEFRTRQSKYLKDIKNRTSNVDNFLVTTGQSDDLQWGELVDVTPSREYTMDQIQQMMMNEQAVKEREKEVLVVNSSIRELNTLFKDLSTMVVDQGTILDRTTHEFVYGAIAELVDNSRDAMANNLHIDYTPNEEYGGMLSILDDGCGMDRKEAISVVSFGHSLKRMEPGMIGQYGNGLKSGAMRIAKDFIMFTKKDGLLTCLLLSRTFHEMYSLKEVFVPVASFTLEGGTRAMYCDSQTQAKMHSQSMDVIYNYTPFDSQDALFEQFERISGQSGTLIVLFNMRRIETGDFELNFDTPYDVRLSNFEEQREEERNSLRAYLSVLYLNPRMKVYLRGKKVLTKRILSTLLYPYRYNYTAKNLKAVPTKEFERSRHKKAKANCNFGFCTVKEMLRLSSSALGEFEAKHRGQNIHANKTLRIEQRLLAKARADMEAKKEQAEKRASLALKAKNNPIPLTFYFGLNIHHRNRYGCMLYNNGRLIEMYVKAAVQKEKNDLMMKCLGVVGVVDVPYSILEPTHNKQSFENKREYLSLLRAMNDHMEQYWKDINLAGSDGPSGIKSFWKNFGYENSDWSSECTNLAEHRKKRFLRIGHTIQCDKMP